LKKKFRTVPPTLREKHRYILVELLSDKKIELDTKKFSKELTAFFLSCFGFLEFAKRNVKLIKWDNSKKTFIIKTNHIYCGDVVAALQFLRKINGIEVIPLCRGISGTLRALRAKKP